MGAVLAGLLLAACSSPSSSSPDSAGPSVVLAPSVQLQGCTYSSGGTVPPDQPAGVQPHYASFAPDAAATAALEGIKRHGGSALLGSFNLTGGVPLYAGPDTGGQKVGTIPDNYAMTVAQPVVWTDPSGDHWFAFFLACGGDNLYWTSPGAMTKADPQLSSTAEVLAADVREAAAASPTQLPAIGIDGSRHFYWKSAKVPYTVGLAQQFGPVA